MRWFPSCRYGYLLGLLFRVRDRAWLTPLLFSATMFWSSSLTNFMLGFGHFHTVRFWSEIAWEMVKVIVVDHKKKRSWGSYKHNRNTKYCNPSSIFISLFCFSYSRVWHRKVVQISVSALVYLRLIGRGAIHRAYYGTVPFALLDLWQLELLEMEGVVVYCRTKSCCSMNLSSLIINTSSFIERNEEGS